MTLSLQHTSAFRHFLKYALFALLIMLGGTCHAQESTEKDTEIHQGLSDTENVEETTEISLLTCTPGHEIHRLYGHSALRIRTQESDWAVNFGWFSFNTPNFVMKFILGLTDYSAAWQTMGIFLNDFCREEMGVTEQCLDLTPAESRKIRETLWKVMEEDGYKTYDIPIRSSYGPNLQEQILGAQWTYRYNFLYDNCTTRVVDAIRWALQSEGEDLIFPNLKNSGQTVTQRQMIHDFTGQSPWYELGQDLMLGPETDEVHSLYNMASTWQNWIEGKKRQPKDEAPNFLPMYALQIFENAYIRDAEGHMRPLVKETTNLTPFLQRKADHPVIPLTPTMAGWLVLALTALVSFGEWKARKNSSDARLQRAWRIWGNALDITLWTVMGCTGVILTILTGWSAHPAVDTNWLTWLFCPAFLLAIIWRCCSQGGDRTVACVTLAAATFTVACRFCGMQWIPAAVLLFAVATAIRAAMALARNVQTTGARPAWKSWGTWCFILVYAVLQLISLRVL